MGFLTGHGNETVQAEAGQALELAKATEQNCVTQRTGEDDNKKRNNILSWCLQEAVRSVQGIFSFTSSNILPLQCKNVTCLAVLTLEMFEGSRAGDAHAQVAGF